MKLFLTLTFSLFMAAPSIAENQAGTRAGVLTQTEQAALTPDNVIMLLKSGNQAFVSGTITTRDHSARIIDAVKGQYPKAIILSCVDSRIPVEDVFNLGIGDIFVARVAGNFSNVDILGSMEFATKISGAKVILVLGHEDCGAIKAAIDGAKLGNITAMLKNIKPSIEALSGYKGEKSSKNPEFVHLVAKKNVELTMQNVRDRSSVIKEMEDAGEIKIIGALYDMHTGAVNFMN
jgi:carbonic anhydrase